MGNGVSSRTLSFHCFTSSADKKSQSACLLDARGNFMRRVSVPLNAAELMLEEEPGHVVSPADDQLKLTCRFRAMKADDQLQAMKTYVLVPIGKINRKVSDADVAAIVDSALTNKRSNKRSGGSRVSPSLGVIDGDDKGFGEIKVNISDDISVNVSDLGFLCRQRGYLRGWKPDLETIRETSKF